MLISAGELKFHLTGYKDPLHKIKRMMDQGELFPLKKGLYETDPDTPGYVIANRIYTPSYLSFQYALSYWNLIPEGVKVYTSASMNKKRYKQYRNHFGFFTYTSIPQKVFSTGVIVVESSYGYFMIAEREKALCDLLYTLPPVKNQKELEGLLFSNLRIYEEELEKFDIENVRQIEKNYHCRNVTLLYKYLKRNMREDL